MLTWAEREKVSLGVESARAVHTQTCRSEPLWRNPPVPSWLGSCNIPSPASVGDDDPTGSFRTELRARNGPAPDLVNAGRGRPRQTSDPVVHAGADTGAQHHLRGEQSGLVPVLSGHDDTVVPVLTPR